jgi:cysteinyl-tRNA synthetase
MSKSLKNFTTIKSALAQPEWNHRLLRTTFLLGLWSDRVEVTEELMKAAAALEGKLNNFFLKSIDIARHPSSNKVSPADQKLLVSLEKAKAEVDTALCDSFNTPVAMRTISDLISDFNSAKSLADETALTVARWVTRMVAIFGLDPEGDLSDPNRVGWSGIEIPRQAQPYIYPASQLRDIVRQQARSTSLDHAALLQSVGSVQVLNPDSSESATVYEDVLDKFRNDVKKLADEKAPAKDLLVLCDQLRDTHLWNLGIYLEDRDPPLPAMVRPVDKALVAARAEREAIATAKAEAKARREAEEAEKKRLLAEKAKVSHLEMFKTAEYTEWDENGIPTKDANGEVAKSKKKKLIKEWEKQKKLHEEWLAGQQKA